jgi:hypothetical protein
MVPRDRFFPVRTGEEASCTLSPSAVKKLLHTREEGARLRSEPYPRRVSRLPSVDVLMGSNGGVGVPQTADMERAVARVPGIQAVRIVTSGDRVSEVHVLAGRGRPPKQLVRDIQSVVLTNFGYEIDYRTVSVVQLEDEEERTVVGPEGEAATAVGEPPASARPALARVVSESTGFDTDVRVLVKLHGAEREGVAHGSATAGLKLVAEAVVDAVRPHIGANAVDVEYADVVPAGHRQLAVTVFRLLTGRGDHVVVGAAVVRRDPNDAMAKAALDAVNRLYTVD